MIEKFAIGDKVSFYCTGTGRGGHNTAYCEVIKINRKSVDLQEMKPSYKPGQIWRCNVEWLMERLTPRGMTHPGYNEKLR